jgi:hypothetical protein
MSELGQKLTSSPRPFSSAPAPKADVASIDQQVCFMPNSDMATFADALRIPRRSVDCR